MILNHISIGISDLPASIKFYDAVLGTLSITRTHDIENLAAAYGEDFQFWLATPAVGKASPSAGTHIAFNAPSRAAVDQFYKEAIAQGGTCEGRPGLRPEYGKTYYAAFVRDLEQNKIEALCKLP